MCVEDALLAFCYVMPYCRHDRNRIYHFRETGKGRVVSYAEAENTVNRLTTDNLIGAFYDNLEEFNEGKEAEQRARIDEKKKRYEEKSKKNENAVLGRSRGVFSGIVNKAASGEYIVTLAVAVRSLVGSDNVEFCLAADRCQPGTDIFRADLYRRCVSDCYAKDAFGRALL